MPAAVSPSPAWKGRQGSLAGVGLIHPSQPWLEDAERSQVHAHALFILDCSGQGSEFVLFVFISFPHNAEKSQHRDKSCQNGRVFSKPLVESLWNDLFGEATALSILLGQAQMGSGIQHPFLLPTGPAAPSPCLAQGSSSLCCQAPAAPAAHSPAQGAASAFSIHRDEDPAGLGWV